MEQKWRNYFLQPIALHCTNKIKATFNTKKRRQISKATADKKSNL